MKVAILLVGLLFATTAQAESKKEAPYPNRPIKWIVPFPPGGNADFIARTLQQKLADDLGQPIVIENKGGAAGIIGMEAAAKSAPDGYTMVIGTTGAIAVNMATYDKLPYNTLKDFTPVAQTTSNAQLAVMHPSVPGSSLKDFISWSKANPGKANIGVAGSGSALHVASELFKRNTGGDMLLVFYKGSGPTVTDLLGGQVHMMIDAPPTSLAYVKAGRLKPLAVTGPKRIPTLPDVPTFEEQGIKGFDASSFQGVLVPVGTPPAIVNRLALAFQKALAQPDVKEKFVAQGVEAAEPSSPEKFAGRIKVEIDKWTKVAKAANIKAE